MLNGSGLFSTNRRAASVFLIYLTFGPGVEGIGSIVVERGTAGFEIGAHTRLMSGERWCPLYPPPWEFQGIQRKFAEMAMKLDAAQLLLCRAAGGAADVVSRLCTTRPWRSWPPTPGDKLVMAEAHVRYLAPRHWPGPIVAGGDVARRVELVRPRLRAVPVRHLDRAERDDGPPRRRFVAQHLPAGGAGAVDGADVGRRPMRLGVVFPQTEIGRDPDVIARFARRVEEILASRTS